MTATRPRGFYAVNSVSSPHNLQTPSNDYFQSQTHNASSNIQSTMITVFDDLMAKVSPKMYLHKYISQGVIENALKNNPNIAQILASKGLTPEIHLENVQNNSQNHYLTTYNKAKELGGNLSVSDYSTLLQSSLLHDIGKVFIPPEILNKPGALTPEEREIVDLHAQLGYEILKTKPISQKVSEAVRTQHLPYKDPKKQKKIIYQNLTKREN